MLSVEEALDRILAQVTPAGVESVPLFEAYDRVLAEDVLSPRDVPPWNNSSMDGYAVVAADTGDGSFTLTLNEVIGAGDVGTIRVTSGTTSAIMTGAPMPAGADAVVKVENTNAARTGEVVMSGKVAPGNFVRPQGGDVATGDRVLSAGAILDGAAVGMIASLGFAFVSVRKRPVVAILSTGDEVVVPGQPLGPGQIYSSNNYTLAGLVQKAGGIARDHGNAPDDLEGLLVCLREAVDGADIVLTTGGVSMGAFDFVKEAHAALGADLNFWKVRMKPGKPLAFGSLNGVPLFGLPGNPVSCMVNFLQFVRPWMRTSLGDPNPYLPVVNATAVHDFSGRGGRARLERVVLRQGANGWTAESTGTQSSGVLTSMVMCNGLLMIGVDTPSPKQGESVNVQLLDPGFLAGATPNFGW
ncbi:MAG: molybdopterin molybdenumtransferase MoeA [Rhodobacterales bacterium]|nr:molybdopterin molybdenumtransferase MoeA [Rhodobacterales bacterium]